MYQFTDLGQSKWSSGEETGGDTCNINDLGTHGGPWRTYSQALVLLSQETQQFLLFPMLVLSVGSLHGPSILFEAVHV